MLDIRRTRAEGGRLVHAGCRARGLRLGWRIRLTEGDLDLKRLRAPGRGCPVYTGKPGERLCDGSLACPLKREWILMTMRLRKQQGFRWADCMGIERRMIALCKGLRNSPEGHC